MRLSDGRSRAAVLLALFFLIPLSLEARESGKAANIPKKIHIVTDQAVVDSRGGSTEFVGNVQLSMDDTKISADWVKITFQNSGGNMNSAAGIDAKSFDTITARGNVRIQMSGEAAGSDLIVAITREALYSSAQNTIVLTGESRITSGEDMISSEKITINMADQSFKAESMGKGPVEATFYTKPEE